MAFFGTLHSLRFFRRRLPWALVPSHSDLCRPPQRFALLKGFFLGVWALCWASPAFASPVSSLFGLWHLCSKRYQLFFLQRCAASVAHRFFMGSSRLQDWALPFWPTGLTIRRSRPPTAAAELRALGLMKSATVFSLIGISLQFIGIAVLSRVDLNAYTLEASTDALRPTWLKEVYESAKTSKENEPSTQELHVQELANRKKPSISLFRGALFLVLLGTALQFVGTWLSD